MDLTKRFKNAVKAFNKTKNGGPSPNDFLRYGSRRMSSTWSTPDISDEDFYTGYGFAVINKRANRSVVLGKNFLYTDAKEEVVAKANAEKQKIVHPYLTLIKNSQDFSERDFWYEISTYLDLEGVYYLMAVRAVTNNGRVGNIQKFVKMNPYNVKPIINSRGELGGYVEVKNGLQREIPKEMVVPITLLNPFNPDKPYSLADAARDSQFTMKQANDFAREAIDGNLNAPGIIASAIELEDDQFDNFVERIKHHGRGEPLFGNGAGTVTYTDMQQDLDKAALDKINSINRDTLLAVSGLSKTGVGVEESGTGREVSRTQKDDFTENAVMPQIENIIDALNLDYRRYYELEYKRSGYYIALSNPLETDKDAELADVEIRTEQFSLMQSLISAGYEYDIAAKYAEGQLGITDIGEIKQEEPELEAEEEVIAEEDIDTEQYLSGDYKSFSASPIPVSQYLGNYTNEVSSITEEGSTVLSTNLVNKKTITISKIDQLEDWLIAVVDDSTFIRLGTFSMSADRAAIIAKLNKRYKNQKVAISKIS